MRIKHFTATAHTEATMTHATTKLARVLGLMALAVTFAVGGCAEPDDINRVQPDVIEKASLDGEWYLVDTVTRAPYASRYAFKGLQGMMERGIFEFEETSLFFYRTYEFVEGVETQGIKGDTDTPLLDSDGNPVTYEVTLADGTTAEATRYVFRSSPLARYPVLGHFDVRKTFNPITGEEANVTVEDARENYWWERDYARIDFGNDMAGHSGRMSIPNALFQGEEAPENLQIRVAEDGAYMDFVTQAFVTAPRTFLSGWGFIPTCLFFPWFTGGYFECDTEEIRIRTAFMKVDLDNTYPAKSLNDYEMNKFGYFRTARGKWDEQYGQTYNAAIRNINTFRLWEEYVDADGDGEMDWADMTPKPVVYYMSEGYPAELVPGSLDLADQWNELFTEVVERLSGTSLDGKRMFVLCENSMDDLAARLETNPDTLVGETDTTYCQDMDQPKYYGDIRYNLLASVNEPTQFGLYGYGPANADPVTGEVIHANAFNYSANIRLGSRNAVDQIEYAAGVQNFRDVTDAMHIMSSVKAKRLDMTQAAPRPSSPTMAEAIQMADNVMAPGISAALTATGGLEQVDVDLAAAGLAPMAGADEFKWVWLNDDMAALAGMPLEELNTTHDDSFLESLTHPMNFGTEDMMGWKRQEDVQYGQQAICMGEHFDASFRGLAMVYKARYDKAVCEGLSGQDDLIFDFSQFNEPGASCDTDAAACSADQVCTFVDQGSVSGKYCITPCSTSALLQQLRDEIRRVNQIDQFAYWDPNALYDDAKDARVTASQLAAREIIEAVREEVFLEVYDRIWSTVAMHEVGHNLGLRHNFASSTDALNYFPGYWDLKGSEATGEWQPFSRWDTLTDSQVAERITEYQQTSIMEYTGAFNARFNGLGSYDRAAILYGYGGLVEVFDNPPALDAWQDYLDEPDADQPDQWRLNARNEHPLAFALRKIHHTNYPEVFGGVDNILSRTVVRADDLILTADVTVEPAELCAEMGGKVFASIYCELANDEAASCQTDDGCGAGKSCLNGRCIYDDDEAPGVCCNTHPEHYTGLDVLNREFEQDYGIVFFGEMTRITDAEVRAGERIACDAFDDPFDTTVCGAGSFCRPFADGHFCTKSDMVEVPFRFCSDEYNWASPDCQTHDEGTDVYDMVRMHIDDYEAYWPFRAYARDNDLFWPASGYWGRVMYSMQFLRKHFEHWAYDYSRYNHNDWWEKKFGQPWHTDINGGLGATIAAQEIFSHMANIFGRPSDGWYGFNEQKERYEPYIDDGDNTYINTFQVREDIGARPMYPSYDFTGYMYVPRRAGTFYDRLGALMMMNFPQTLFVRGADTWYDLKRFRLNFATVWPMRVQNIMSGLLTSDPGTFGWCIEHDGVSPTEGGDGDVLRVKPRLWFGDDEELDDWYANCTPLTPEPEYSFPTTQYRLPAVTSIYAMGWGSQTFDRTFMDRTRLWLKGEGNDLAVPEGFATIEYTDPFSGKTYIAPYDPQEFDPSAPILPRDTLPPTDGGFHGHTNWPAAQLLARANYLVGQGQVQEYNYSELQQLVGRLEILRGLYQYFEYGY